MIAYVTSVEEHHSYDYLKDNLETSLALYEPEGPDDMMRNLVEYTSAVKLFHYFAENSASTLSARMQAMGNSSTNANEMIATLTLFLNRSRQAKITTELSEIVGGAAAVDEEMGDADAEDTISPNDNLDSDGEEIVEEPEGAEAGESAQASA